MNKTVLIIEDDIWFAEQQARVLSGAGYNVHHVNNGLDGIEAIDMHQPDVVILDIFLPGPNGLVLLHELQSHVDLAQIPVVVCSNSVERVALGQLDSYGVKQVVDKSTMELDGLEKAVKRVLP